MRAFAAASHPPPRREGEARRSDRAAGVLCACAANSCHLVRNKSSEFPKSPWAGGHCLLLFLLHRVVLSPQPARQVTAFPESGGRGGGRGRRGLPGTAPPPRAAWGCWRPGERRRRGRDAPSVTAATVTLGRERPAAAAGEGCGGR